MRFKYFFDAGAGTCLWAADDAARARFDYAVELAQLPLDDETRAQAQALIARFDTSLDWNDPAGPSPWTDAMRTAFAHDADALLARLRAHLDAAEPAGAFEIVDARD